MTLLVIEQMTQPKRARYDKLRCSEDTSQWGGEPFRRRTSTAQWLSVLRAPKIRQVEHGLPSHHDAVSTD